MAHYGVTVTGEALAAATAETLLMVIAGSGRRARIKRWGVSFNGANVSDVPIQVQLMRFTSNGSSSEAAATKLDPTSESALAVVRTAFTAEPSTSDILESHYVSPAGGNLIEVYFDDAPVVPAVGRIGIRLLGNAAVNVSGFMIFEE